MRVEGDPCDWADQFPDGLVPAALDLVLQTWRDLRKPSATEDEPKITERLGRTGLALILGGAVGNAVDRVLHGAVIDFLDFGVGSLRWYTFNLADACVTTGAGLLILSCSFLRREGSASDGNGDPAGP